LVDELRVDGAASPAHVRVLFNVPNAPMMGSARLGSAEVLPFEFERGAAQFDLSATAEIEHSRRVYFEYSTRVFTAASVQRLASHYLHLLQQALATPHAPVSSLATLTDAELRALQQRHRDNARALPRWQRADQWIAAQAARTPSAVALSQGAQQLTYAELDRRAN